MNVEGYAEIFWNMREFLGLYVKLRGYAFLKAFMRDWRDLCVFRGIYA